MGHLRKPCSFETLNVQPERAERDTGYYITVRIIFSLKTFMWRTDIYVQVNQLASACPENQDRTEDTVLTDLSSGTMSD